MKQVDIVIPNYFRNKTGRIITDGDEEMWFARHCFERIKKFTTVPYKLILIDNGSVHGRELLKEYADKLVVLEKNEGFAHGCNAGFDTADSEWILCVNNDIFVWEGWLKALLKTFKDNKDCGVAMPALMKQTKKGEEALKFKEIDLSKNYFSYGSGAEFGSCWLSKKEVLDKVRQFNNGKVFDENFKCGFGEDRLLWKQIRWLGYQTYRTHKTRVFHQGNITMGTIKNRKDFTHPNRIYLKKILEAYDNGIIYSEHEKKRLREQADIEWQEQKKIV